MTISPIRLEATPAFSLEPAKAPAKALFTPSYTAALLAVIQTLEEMHETGSKLHGSQSAQIQRLQMQLEELQKQTLEVRKQLDEKAQTSGAWAAMGTICDYMLTATRLVLGLLLRQAAPDASTTLIITSLVSIANIAFSACGVWEWMGEQIAQENHELALQLSTLMPFLVGFVSTAVGFSAGNAIFAIENQIEWPRQMLAIAQTALGLADGVAHLGKARADYGTFSSKAELTQFQKGIKNNEYQLEGVMDEMEQMMKTLSDCTSTVTRVLKASMYSSQQTVQL